MVKIVTGIKPDGKLYSLDSILEAVRAAIGYSPGVKCNADASGPRQLHQIYICVDTSGSRIIECPGLPNSGCTFAIKVGVSKQWGIDYNF